MRSAQTDPDLFGLAKSLLLLAVVGFLAGFGGYLLLGPPDVARLGARAGPVATVTASVQTSAPPRDEGNPARPT